MEFGFKFPDHPRDRQLDTVKALERGETIIDKWMNYEEKRQLVVTDEAVEFEEYVQ